MLQCAHRFEELKSMGGFPHVDNQCNALIEGSSSPSDLLSTLLDTRDIVERGSGQSSSSKVTGQLLSPTDKTFNKFNQQELVLSIALLMSFKLHSGQYTVHCTWGARAVCVRLNPGNHKLRLQTARNMLFHTVSYTFGSA